jgi:hypothetical protein
MQLLLVGRCLDLSCSHRFFLHVGGGLLMEKSSDVDAHHIGSSPAHALVGVN